MSAGPAVELRGVTRRFGATVALDEVSLSIAPGEFFAMLGPSGSGKTTCLRVIAGFETPERGRVLLDGEDVSHVPPYDRNVNTVFQDYALFPHLSLAENVAYGLRMRGVAAAERHRRAGEMLELVKLASLGDRKPAQLSGGQRQRVALARALANRPRVLLLDEPLGALDLKLREEMQLELRHLHRTLGITFIYVTHDQGEALSMADRVAVFDRGRIEQLDPPRQLYAHPQTAFVARFVGGANVIEGALAARLRETRPGGDRHDGDRQAFAVRPEQVRLIAPGEPLPEDWMSGEAALIGIQYHGAVSRWQLQLEAGAVVIAAVAEDRRTQPLPAIGTRVRFAWPEACAVRLQPGPHRLSATP